MLIDDIQINFDATTTLFDELHIKSGATTKLLDEINGHQFWRNTYWLMKYISTSFHKTCSKHGAMQPDFIEYTSNMTQHVIRCSKSKMAHYRVGWWITSKIWDTTVLLYKTHINDDAIQHCSIKRTSNQTPYNANRWSTYQICAVQRWLMKYTSNLKQYVVDL